MVVFNNLPDFFRSTWPPLN